MKATIHYNDGTENVFEDAMEKVEAHLRRLDLRSVAVIEIGDKRLPNSCVAIKDLDAMLEKALLIVAETLPPGTSVKGISWNRIAYNVVACVKAMIKEGTDGK